MVDLNPVHRHFGGSDPQWNRVKIIVCQEEEPCVGPSASLLNTSGASSTIWSSTGTSLDWCYDACALCPSWKDARQSLEAFTHFIWVHRAKHIFKNYNPNTWRFQVDLWRVSCFSHGKETWGQSTFGESSLDHDLLSCSSSAYFQALQYMSYFILAASFVLLRSLQIFGPFLHSEL